MDTPDPAPSTAGFPSTGTDAPENVPRATVAVADGGYRAIPAGIAYSAGVAALPGFTIRRVRFRRPVPLATGFGYIERLIDEADRPLASFCGCELRSPEPFTPDGFRRFNEGYVEPLARWGIFDGTLNPVSRSNVCPAVGAPGQPSFYAFSYTVPDDGAAPSFVVSGSAEPPRPDGSEVDESLSDKARLVLDEQERRLGLLGFTWADVTATQVYTVHDLPAAVASEAGRRGAAPGGLAWHLCRPPVEGLAFEMDCRHVGHEDSI